MPGIRRHRWGLEAYVKVRGKTYTKSFALGTPANKVQAWRAKTKAEHLVATATTRGTLSHDIERYVQNLNGRAKKDATHWLGLWRQRFGDKRRAEITRDMMQEALNTWSKRYAASSLNHLRTYYINVCRHHEGKRHGSPMLDIPKFNEPEPKPRWVDPAWIDKVFGVMRPSRSKARLMLAFATAARPCEIGMINPATDFHLDDVDTQGEPSPWVFMNGRKRCDDRAIPLNEFGMRAVKMFLETKAQGPYSSSSARDAFIGACKRAKIDDFVSLVEGIYPSGRNKYRLNPYVLRHTTLTELRRKGADLADVQAIGGHKKISTTKRYSPVVQEKLRVAMGAIDREPKTPPQSNSRQEQPQENGRPDGASSGPLKDAA